MAPSIPVRDHTAQTDPDTETRRTSYTTALAAVEHMPAASPVAPAVAAQLHELEDPSVEDAFAHLAIDHPDAVSASLSRPEAAK